MILGANDAGMPQEERASNMQELVEFLRAWLSCYIMITPWWNQPADAGTIASGVDRCDGPHCFPKDYPIMARNIIEHFLR